MSKLPAVEVSGLVKRYGPATAVDGLTLTAAAGEVTAILGPNGAGKTTTIEICEGYRAADDGTVHGGEIKCHILIQRTTPFGDRRQTPEGLSLP